MKTIIFLLAVVVFFLPLASYGIDSIMSDILLDNDPFMSDMEEIANGNGFEITHRIGTLYDPYDKEIIWRETFISSIAKTYIDAFEWRVPWDDDYIIGYDITLFEFIMLPITSLVEFLIPIKLPW